MSEEEFDEVEEAEEARELADFGERAIRPSRGGAYERLVCQHLVLAVTSDPINSILHTCRAALSLPSHVTKKLEIDKKRVSDILTVALNFKTAQVQQSQTENPSFVNIIWSFNQMGEEGFKRFIEPWLTTEFSYYISENVKRDEHEQWRQQTPCWKVFYSVCRRLPVHSFHSLLSAWASWAYPFVEELSQKVSTQVSPTTYTEILEMFKKFEGG